jgi:macrolide-specific efflux system membrane fusion protein
VAKQTRRRRVPRLLIVPAVCVIAAATFFGARATAAKKTPTAAATERTVQATKGTMNQAVSASGTLAPAATEELSFTASGTVTAVKVKAGQKVKKGQVLATIDSAALASQVVQAEAQVAADESTLESDESNDASSAQLTADRATLASAQAQLESARTALAGASLVSPISGTVSAVNLSDGQQLGSTGDSATDLTGSRSGATTPAASSDGSDASSSSAQIEVVSNALVVNLSVDDTEIANLKAGQAATVSASGTVASPSGGGTDAKVATVGTIASASSGVATFPVVVRVTGSTAGLYAGATAQVSIVYNQLTDVIQVPALAVTQTNGQSFVTVSVAGEKTKRAVTTGITSDGQVQITSGLKAGENVVVAIPTARGSNGSPTDSGRQPTGEFFFGPNGGPPKSFGSGGTGQ